MSTKRQLDILNTAVGIYHALAGDKHLVIHSIATDIIIHAYRDKFAKLTSKALLQFINQNKWFMDAFNYNRRTVSLYGSPVVILLFWLVNNFNCQIRERWPIDMFFLDEFLNSVGISSVAYDS